MFLRAPYSALFLLLLLGPVVACSGDSTTDSESTDTASIDTVGGDATIDVASDAGDAGLDTADGIAEDLSEDAAGDILEDSAGDASEDSAEDASEDSAEDASEDEADDTDGADSLDSVDDTDEADGEDADSDASTDDPDTSESNPCDVYIPFDFEKSNGGDEADCVTDSVCLTRGATGPIFNSVTEESAASGGCDTVSPAGTEWAPGPCLANDGPFTGFPRAAGCSPRSAVGETLCLHVITEDLYYDVAFTSFTGGGGGGGFAYTRTLAAGGPCGAGALCDYDSELDCSCPSGTTGDGETDCEDVDECAGGEDPCADTGTCVNFGGGYTCDCEDGYELDEAGTACIDVDECLEVTCGDNGECENSEGSYDCVCEDGYLGDGYTCVEDAGCDPACADDEICTLVEETPTCGCLPGFEPSDAGCVDVDECGLGAVRFDHRPGDEPDCITDTVCISRWERGGPIYNTLLDTPSRGDLGSGDVDWPSGTEWALGECQESDLEFDILVETMSSNMSEVVGVPLCMRAVAEGATLDVTFHHWGVGEYGRAGEFGYTRVDAGFPCGAGALCENTVGSVSCTCEHGFEGDPLLACTDIDDCADAPCASDDDDECLDRLGSYECLCPTGEAFADDGCESLNECELPSLPTVFFSHEAGDDPDCITDSVCFDRSGDGGPIYNSVTDPDGKPDEECESLVPTGTSWARGTCAESFGGDFHPFLSSRVSSCEPPGLVGDPLCLRLDDDDVYFDIVFTDWGIGELEEEGRFAYERTQFIPPCSELAECADRADGYTCTCEEGVREGDGFTCLTTGLCDACEASDGECTGQEDDSLYCLCNDTKVIFQNPAGEDGEDCLTDDVCLARLLNGKIYNSVTEDGYDAAVSPAGTLWYEGTCAESNPADFMRWHNIFGRPDLSGVGHDTCILLLESGLLIDYKLTSWTGGDTGAYTHSRTRIVEDDVCPEATTD